MGNNGPKMKQTKCVTMQSNQWKITRVHYWARQNALEAVGPREAISNF
jgi:hypothetical protein